MREKFDKGRKMSLYQHWDEQVYFRNVQIFMNDLKLPQELIDEENTLKLLTMLFPCSIKKIRPTECIEVREMLLSTFRENCAKKRENFFSDPLVRYLWNNIFMHEVPEVLSNHTRWIKSDPKYGDVAIQKFVMCLR